MSDTESVNSQDLSLPRSVAPLEYEVQRHKVQSEMSMLQVADTAYEG